MIAQTCHLTVPAERADEFLPRLRTVSIVQCQKTPGNVAAFALVRTERNCADLMLLSFWASLESIPVEAQPFIDANPIVQVHTVFDDDRFPAGGGAAVARLWHGAVPLSKSEAYLALMRSVALEDYARTAGNRAAFVLHRVADGLAHFTMLTFWESPDAIKAFAGDNIEAAKYYGFDREYLVELEPAVLHYEILRNA